MDLKIQDFDFKIGMSFSGGGYRAASFSLGVITFLNTIKLGKTQTLLNKVIALSTVSGGTITGARYALGITQNENVENIYRELYTFMLEVDLVNLSLERLGTNYHWKSLRSHNLINAFADIYHHKLFNEARFGNLLEPINPLHLKHISFNATEFANALQFRFQVSEKIKNPKSGEPDRGVIGNFYYKISPEDAKEIRMGDILAASSCFPGGFEPILFPDDFEISITKKSKPFTEKNDLPVGLMDGGIVDNQGIEPLILADKRMKRASITTEEMDDSPALDLLIICDVASPYMESYSAAPIKTNKGLRNLTIRNLFMINALLLLVSVGLIFMGIRNNSVALIICSTVFSTISGIAFLLSLVLGWLPRILQVPALFLKPLRKLLNIKVGLYENLLTNRISSMLKLTGEVFLKHIRRLNYNTIFDDPYWKNRRIMTAVYKLRPGEEWKSKIKKGTLPEYLRPSLKIQNTAKHAASMPTALWFTGSKAEKRKMLDSLIATGQFTTCWSLLEYMYKLSIDDENTGECHVEFQNLQELLLEHWNRFQEDPFWLIKAQNT